MLACGNEASSSVLYIPDRDTRSLPDNRIRLMKRKSLSRSLIDAAKELGFPKATVAHLEELDIPAVKDLSARQIREIRNRVRVSQGVFAALLNVNPSTVQKWEQGKVRPQNAALRLLNIIDSKGIDVLK
jgi:putative transcriptional regulator